MPTQKKKSQTKSKKVKRSVEKLPAPVTPTPKVRVELWAYDEYNQGSIVASGTDIDKVVARAREFVTDANVTNALASGELGKAWEAYFVEVVGKNGPIKDVLYVGNKRDGKHYVAVLDKESGKYVTLPMPKEVKTKFYLGQILKGREKEDWYLTDHRGKEITSLSDPNLERKTMLFLKIVG